MVDDASGVTPTSRPWLEQLAEKAVILAAADPKVLKRRSPCPFLLFAAWGIAMRYVARAQGDLDLYVIGGISIAVMLVFSPFSAFST